MMPEFAVSRAIEYSVSFKRAFYPSTMSRKEKFGAAYNAIKALQEANIEIVGKGTALKWCLIEYFRKTKQQRIFTDMTGILAGGLITAAAFPEFGPAIALKAMAVAAGVKAMIQNLQTAEEEKKKLIQVQEEITNEIKKRTEAILHLVEVLEPLGMDLHAGPVERITATQLQSRLIIGSINGVGATFSIFEMMIKFRNSVVQNVHGYSTASDNEVSQRLKELLAYPNDTFSGYANSLSTMIDNDFNNEIDKTAVIVAGTGLMFANFAQLLIDWQSVCPFIRKLDCITRDLQWEVNELNTVERYVKETEMTLIKEETVRTSIEIEKKENEIKRIERIRTQGNGNQDRITFSLFHNRNNGNNAGL